MKAKVYKISRERAIEIAMNHNCVSTEQDYLRIVESIGFKSILIEPFINEDGIEERLHIMWNENHSILLVFDTYTWGDDGSWAKAGESVPPPSINGGHFYYNWIPNADCKTHCTSSGGYVDDHVWSGDHDCREAIKFNIGRLLENGRFVKEWKEAPFLWLLHYMDTKKEGYDYKKINKERLSKLPEQVLKAMNIDPVSYQ